jgi:acyl-CoA dehydrogenase
MAVDRLVEKTRTFVEERVVPVDDAHDGDDQAAGGDALRHSVQAEARRRGLRSPHGPREYGRLGLGIVDRAPVFEAAGYSLFGPMALNINAPDEGNIHLLDHVASTAQRARYPGLPLWPNDPDRRRATHGAKLRLHRERETSP